MSDHAWLAERFEERRARLRAVAYRMLGSVSEAEDAVQEAWLRLDRTDPVGVQNLDGWLTTVVARICLNALRTRRSRPETRLDAPLPDPIVDVADPADPEQEAIVADSVGLALMVVLETLTPVERLAFVLHDVFAMPFDDIAPIVGRSSGAARQLASRARRRVQGATPASDAAARTDQGEVVDAFLAASRTGDLDTLVMVLDPDVVVRTDWGSTGRCGVAVTRGARAVAAQAVAFARRYAPYARPVLVNGGAGILALTPDGRPYSIMAFSIARRRIVEIDILADQARLDRLALPSFES
jgi:RNA polymerase sigma factor (sigma-70 family)